MAAARMRQRILWPVLSPKTRSFGCRSSSGGMMRRRSAVASGPTYRMADVREVLERRTVRREVLSSKNSMSSHRSAAASARRRSASRITEQMAISTSPRRVACSSVSRTPWPPRILGAVAVARTRFMPSAVSAGACFCSSLPLIGGGNPEPGDQGGDAGVGGRARVSRVEVCATDGAKINPKRGKGAPGLEAADQVPAHSFHGNGEAGVDPFLGAPSPELLPTAVVLLGWWLAVWRGQYSRPSRRGGWSWRCAPTDGFSVLPTRQFSASFR